MSNGVFNAVANSRKVTQFTEVAASNHVALVNGHIGKPATAAKIVETALSLVIEGRSGGQAPAPMFVTAGTLPPDRATTCSAVLNRNKLFVLETLA